MQRSETAKAGKLFERAVLRDWVLRSALITLITWFGGPTPAAAQAPSSEPGNPQHSMVNDFLTLPVRPIAIGHHGVGPYTPATNPGLPIENTVDSVRQAYTLGARVVEVDVQLTADGQLAVFHDDFLSDFTCIHSLTLDQLRARLPYVPELRHIINVAREFNNRAGGDLGGILIVELKAFSPLCDPGDNLEQPVVTAAVNEIRHAQYTDRVMFDSFSPALLYLAEQMAPEIPRELDLDGLQLLTPTQVQAVTGLPVTVISKKISLGLTWAEIGPIYRLPGYASPVQFLITGLVTSVRVVGAEMDFLGAAEQQQPGSGTEFVAVAHSLGMRAFADPANTPADWNFFASLGVDAIYSTIPMGVQLQPAIPDH
ncbi:MAG TPA: glycerophosphodiester phosphodiesterase [Candidatus Acidoferrum sp.]|nr:glycerophosphodiester phosphodiesterase [Candidatus Acidoferrum sp.]